MKKRSSKKEKSNPLWFLNVFRDPGIRNMVMIVCGLAPGFALQFEVIERTPFSPYMAGLGVAVGLLSISPRQCLENAVLSVIGFISSFLMMLAYRVFPLVRSGQSLAGIGEMAEGVVIGGVTAGFLYHGIWLLALPLGYGLRRMIKGEKKSRARAGK